MEVFSKYKFLCLSILFNSSVATCFAQSSHSKQLSHITQCNHHRQNDHSIISPPFDFAHAFVISRPWVISIAAGVINYEQDKKKKYKPRFAPQSEGSGVIWGPKRYIITNAHVVKDFKNIRGRTFQKQVFRLEVVGIYPELDVALLKTKTPDALANSPYACYKEDLPVQGSWVAAVGHPYSMPYSLSTGVVSALHRGKTLSEWAKFFPGFIQTNITLNPGNSGGPLIDLYGNMIGLNTAIRQGAVGMSFALPMSRIIPVVEQLKEYSKFSRSYVGLKLSEVSFQRGQRAGFKAPQGVRIKRVTNQGPASIAGLKKNDLILKVNGETFNEPSALSWRLISALPNVPLAVEIVRTTPALERFIIYLTPKSYKVK